MTDLTIGQGIALAGYLYLLTHIISICLTRYLDRQALRIRLESEERQAKLSADLSMRPAQFDNTVTHREG